MSEIPRLISERQAASMLAEVGVSRRQSRKLLAAGFAGEPIRTSTASLYDEAQVAALTARPVTDLTALDAAFPHGIFVARRAVDVRAPRERQVEELARGWRMSPANAIWISVHLDHEGPLPFVATTCGFVAFGADIMDVHLPAPQAADLQLQDPGEWYASLEGRRLPIGPGAEWVIRNAPWDRLRRAS
jgi:hypothetical protein